MSLPPWFSLRRAKTADGGWIGMQAGRDRVLVACAKTGPDGKVRISQQQCFAGAERLSALLQWQKQSAPKGSRTNLLLEPSEYQILQIDAPAVEEAERKSAVRWQMKDLIDFPPDEAALDCMSVPGEVSANAPQRLLSVVARKSVITSWMGHWHAAKLSLSSIDIGEMALRNLAVLASGEQAVAFLHIGWDTTHLIIVWRESLCTFRQLSVGGEQLLILDEMDRAQLFERFALEIQRTTDAFGRQFSAATLTRVWLSSVVDAPGVAIALSGQVDLHVEPFVLGDWVTFEDPPSEGDVEQRLDYTLAIGAALRVEAVE
ncbi:MAG: pilus assembly protein PilM [Burkholderiales bacterium]|nr:pilus assembly protein PilM [Burkholderiales bacterium]